MVMKVNREYRLTYAQNYFTHFTDGNSFNSHYNPSKWIMLLFTYKNENMAQ